MPTVNEIYQSLGKLIEKESMNKLYEKEKSKLSTSIVSEQSYAAYDDPLLEYIKKEVPFRMNEIYEIDVEKEIMDSLIYEVYNNADVMFNYDRLDNYILSKYSELRKGAEDIRLLHNGNRNFYDTASAEKIWSNSMDNQKQNLDLKINDAMGKRYSEQPNKISLQETETYIGIKVDKCFNIILDGKAIGKCAISEMDNNDEIFLEWIEFSPESRGKHLLRATLLSLSEYCHVKHILFDTSELNTEKYIHLGAVKTSYDEFREVQGFKLSVDILKKEVTKEDKEISL